LRPLGADPRRRRTVAPFEAHRHAVVIPRGSDEPRGPQCDLGAAHVGDDQEGRIEIVLVVEEGVRETPSGDELGVPSSAITATSR
jgi:hypothetical protein